MTTGPISEQTDPRDLDAQDIPSDIMIKARAVWIAALEDGSPDAAKIIGRAIYAERMASFVRADEHRIFEATPYAWDDVSKHVHEFPSEVVR